jgi:hypothetical protein
LPDTPKKLLFRVRVIAESFREGPRTKDEPLAVAVIEPSMRAAPCFRDFYGDLKPAFSENVFQGREIPERSVLVWIS